MPSRLDPTKRTFDARRCPLCSGTVITCSLIQHLINEHRRTEPEARIVLHRSVEGTLGWDPEAKKKSASFPLGSE